MKKRKKQTEKGNIKMMGSKQEEGKRGKKSKTGEGRREEGQDRGGKEGGRKQAEGGESRRRGW